MIEKDRILLFTRYYTLLYDENFEQLTVKYKNEINESVWWVNAAQPGYSAMH